MKRKHWRIWIAAALLGVTGILFPLIGHSGGAQLRSSEGPRPNGFTPTCVQSSNSRLCLDDVQFAPGGLWITGWTNAGNGRLTVMVGNNDLPVFTPVSVPRPDTVQYGGRGFSSFVGVDDSTDGWVLLSINSPDFSVSLREGIQVGHGIMSSLDNVEVLGADSYYVTYRLTGWALDHDTDQPVVMNHCLKSPGHTTCPFVDIANKSRPDVATVFRFGPNHGFVVTIRFPIGQVSCLTASDIALDGRETYNTSRSVELFCAKPGMQV